MKYLFIALCMCNTVSFVNKKKLTGLKNKDENTFRVSKIHQCFSD